MRQLHWFQTDLRLADNPALSSAQDADSLLCIYLMPKPRPWCNLTGLGPQRVFWCTLARKSRIGRDPIVPSFTRGPREPDLDR